MRYNPRRDIPKAVRELRTTSPTQIVKWVKNHRTETDAYGKKRQVVRSPQSVTMWFKDNPDILKQLEAEITQDLEAYEGLNEVIFENGNFRELPSIKNWIRDLSGTNVTKTWINYIKRVCMGNLRLQGGKVDIENWGLRHPDVLSLDDAKEFIFQLREHGYRTREWRLALRSFLPSKGIVVKSTDISGELEEDAGKYAQLFVEKSKIYEILEYIKAMNYDAYLASKFAFTTASRLTATLTATTEWVNYSEKTIVVFEKSKRRKAKRRIRKHVRPDLWEELGLDKGKKGRLFKIEAFELNAILKEAYNAVIPQLSKNIPMPFHFWRHMFAQHMLRASGWNTQLVASLGGWTTEALEKYYGRPTQEVVDAFARNVLPKI